MDNFIGEIRPFAGNYAPTDDGWLPCDGRLLQISQYNTLYALLGTKFGGDGVSTFGIPDLRGRLAIGAGQGAGLNANYAFGQVGGSESVSLNAANAPVHTHAFIATTATATTDKPTGNLFANPNPNAFYATTPSTGSTPLLLNADTIPMSGGSSSPIENRMPTLAITYIIATTGIYPTQP